jgi:CBS domain containing-hemolysin-like protein
MQKTTTVLKRFHIPFAPNSTVQIGYFVRVLQCHNKRCIQNLAVGNDFTFVRRDMLQMLSDTARLASLMSSGNENVSQRYSMDTKLFISLFHSSLFLFLSFSVLPSLFLSLIVVFSICTSLFFHFSYVLPSFLFSIFILSLFLPLDFFISLAPLSYRYTVSVSLSHLSTSEPLRKFVVALRSRSDVIMAIGLSVMTWVKHRTNSIKVPVFALNVYIVNPLHCSSR